MAAMSAAEIYFLAAYLFVVAFGAVAVAYLLWPPSRHLAEEEIAVRFWGHQAMLGGERRLFLLVLVMGIIGGSAWALWFFAKNAAEGAQSSDLGLKDAQFIWYVLRPWTASLMTLVFYGIVRSGLLVVADGRADVINVYGTCGLMGVAGFAANEVFEKFIGIVHKIGG